MGLEYTQSHQCCSEFGRFSDDMEYSGQPGDVAASHSAGTAYVSAARPGPDKVRVERPGEPVEAVSHTLPRQPPVYSGENVNLPEVSLSDTSVSDIEVEQNMSESEVQNFVRSGEVSQPVVNEVSEVSRNPSSRSTLSVSEERRSPRSAKYTAEEARRKLENMISEVRSQTGSPLSVFRPVEFESTPVSSCQYRSYVRSEAIPEVTQVGKHTGYSRLDDEVLVRIPVSGQPVRVTPRQPYGQSLVDPAAPTRVFGSTVQREATVVKKNRNYALPPLSNPLVSGGDSNWSWSSVEQLGQAVDELVRGPKSQSLSSQGSLSAANVEVEGPS